jgi:Na+/melibiose symporter-like transporter
MATGMAIMGFGGGAMIGSPLAENLMRFYASPTSVGVIETFLTMGLIYFVLMMFGVFNVRVPPDGWKPKGYVPSTQTRRLVTLAHVTADEAIKTPQFWMLWGVLCMNVTAGIGILAQASPLIQESFPGSVTPAAAAGFVGLLSLFSLVGRFFWSSLSDKIGRRTRIYLGLGMVLYPRAVVCAREPRARLLTFCVILSMRRRLCDDSRSPRLFGTSRWARSGRSDRVVGRRHRRPEHRHLHPRVPVAARRREGGRLLGRDLHHGRRVGDRLRL